IPASDTTPPTVSITGPMSGATLAGSINVTAAVSDASAIGGVQLLVDGIPFGPPDTGAPYSLPLDTTPFANGAHTLQAYAWDQFFNVGNATPVSVTFSNASPGNPSVSGVWTGVIPSPIVATASALVPGGKILQWDGQTNGFDARVWDPMFNSFAS